MTIFSTVQKKEKEIQTVLFSRVSEIQSVRESRGWVRVKYDVLPVAGVFVTTVSVISSLSYFCILAARAMETRVLLVDISASMGAVDLKIAKTALMSLVQQKMIQVSPHCLLLRCAKNWARGHIQLKSSSELHYARCRRSERSCGWFLSHYVPCGCYSHLSATCVPRLAPACAKFAGLNGVLCSDAD